MRTFFKILMWMVAVVLVIGAGVFIYVELNWQKTYSAPYPEISASTDSALIARGEYLIYGPAHCVYCHTPPEKFEDIDNGEKVPLVGGWSLTIPPGTFRAPNITPHSGGIGDIPDKQLARSLRYMVNSNDQTIMPFMPFSGLSDEDLTAIISYLRSTDAIENEIPKSELSFMGRMIMAFGMIKPSGPEVDPPKSVNIAPTVEYGSYLANSVADCNGCHTLRSMKTGEFIGEPFAGGNVFIDEHTKGYTFITPNITPHQTGIMSGWTEEQFIARMRTGRVHKYSPMPWGAYSRMTDVDLKAIYSYLQTLDPVDNTIEKIVYTPDEDAPAMK